MKYIILLLVCSMFMFGCDESTKTSDQKQKSQQKVILQEATNQIGMPAIKNFREKRILKEILEMRDQSSLITYTYMKSEVNNDLKLLCKSIGYPIPYATQFTNPQRPATYGETPMQGNLALPQEDPNALFSPSSAEGTWVLCVDPSDSKNVKPVYIEPKVITSQFPLK